MTITRFATVALGSPGMAEKPTWFPIKSETVALSLPSLMKALCTSTRRFAMIFFPQADLKGELSIVAGSV